MSPGDVLKALAAFKIYIEVVKEPTIADIDHSSHNYEKIC